MDSEHLTKQAKMAYDSEDYPQSAELFAKAAEEHRASGDFAKAAEMDNNRSVALLKANRPEEALEAALGTDEVFAQLGDARRQAMALGNQAAAHEELKHYDEAMELYRRSSELFKEAGEKDMRSYVLQRISTLQIRRGERIEAMATMQTAMDNRAKKGVKERVLKGLLDKVGRLMGQK